MCFRALVALVVGWLFWGLAALRHGYLFCVAAGSVLGVVGVVAVAVAAVVVVVLIAAVAVVVVVVVGVVFAASC